MVVVISFVVVVQLENEREVGGMRAVRMSLFGLSCATGLDC